MNTPPLTGQDEFNCELVARLNELVTPAHILVPGYGSSPADAEAARRLINTLTPLRATVEQGRGLIDHPSIPVGVLHGDVVVGGWLSIINGLCGPNADIRMARGPGRIEFTLHTYGHGDGGDVV